MYVHACVYGVCSIIVDDSCLRLLVREGRR